MNKLKWLLLIVSGVVLGGCSSLSQNTAHSGKLERVGVLLVQDCDGDSSCSKLSLLEPDMQTRRVALSGKVDAALQGRLIAVLGTGSGGKNGLELVRVEQTRAITEFDYQPFLNQAVADYIQKKYACTSFWDQSYAWRLDGRQPVLIASLSHPFEPASGKLNLEFDGLTQAMLSAKSDPDTANPCQLR